KSTSMNFLTALGLSGRNLATKKGRTALVSFAGSIGIIGIALVLSISNGFTKYIDKLQTDTLAGFPIQVTQQTVDIASLTSMVGGSGEKHEEFPTSGKVEIYTQSISTMLYYNDISDDYISYIKNMDSSWSKAIAYTNSVDMFVLRKNRTGKAEIIGGETASLMGSTSVWQEMLPTAEYMGEQYSVMAGKMPTEKNELAIVIDKNNRISTSVLDALRLHYQTDEKSKLDLEKLIPNTGEPDFLIVANDNLYPDGTYKNYSSADYADELDTLFTTEGEAGQKNIPLKIVGVLRINKGIPLEMFNCGIVYTPALTQAVLEMNGESAIVQTQKEQCEIPLGEGRRVWDNRTFYDVAGLTPTIIETEKNIAAFEAQAGMTLEELLKNNPSLTGTPFEANAEMIIEFAKTRDILKKRIAYYENRALESLGAASRASSIFIYPKDFESKKKINNYLDDWNKKYPEKKVMYTDASELLASTMGNMVNIISYVLIAFAAVSLIVSSIMIAIITYSSVIERTKEIGVLRSIGARKKDISRVFNAETVLIGFIAGLIGVFIAFLLTFPINAIIGAVIDANGGGSLGIGNLASLSPVHALVLVCISIVLTLISGFIPSRIAAKKDPVTALRTE
ncbi:MAG: FtsX-like permease family protein, partial [Clostridiales bacterium]|nr:FtsX-like permease family protein [Clostridiales bacterium]